MMEEDILNVISGLIEGRNTFITRTVNRMGPTLRDSLLARFLINEQCYMELLNRLHQNHMRTTAAATTLLTMNLPANFTEPVIVAPTADHIARGTVVVAEPPANTRCAICQEDITANATQIRHCGHMYHQPCFTQWFSLSVRCPVCRHDIRTGLPAQTQPDSE